MSIYLSLDAIFPVRKLLVMFTVNVVIDNFLNGQCKTQAADLIVFIMQRSMWQQ